MKKEEECSIWHKKYDHDYQLFKFTLPKIKFFMLDWKVNLLTKTIYPQIVVWIPGEFIKTNSWLYGGLKTIISGINEFKSIKKGI